MRDHAVYNALMTKLCKSAKTTQVEVGITHRFEKKLSKRLVNPVKIFRDDGVLEAGTKWLNEQ
jgi:hypothetical protein